MKRSYMILLIATIVTGLMAGLFFAWSFSVTPGIAFLPDREYLAAMQMMNRAILNPVFLSCFMGAAILLPLSTWLEYERPLPVAFWCLLAASAVYLIGVLGLTSGGNVPMNNALDVFNLSTASVEEIAARRASFEIPWNRLNNIRTFAAIVSFALSVLACLYKR
jgi:uncharacterized membrane protein